ncbi:MAG: hypothetical protein ABEJ40_08820 [Haloarculaceae archaeon]
MDRFPRLADRTSRLVARLSRRAGAAPDPPTVARVGLGATVALAGVHKLAAPGAWTVYVTDWLAPWLVVGVVENGLFVDVLVRDVGLAALAWAVTLRALRTNDAAKP